MSHAVMVVDFAPGNLEQEEFTKVRIEMEKALVLESSKIILGELGNALVILVPWAKQQTRAKEWRTGVIDVHSRLTQNCPGILFNAGVGKFYKSATMLYRSYQQAKVALELSKLIPNYSKLAFFDELGAFRLFYNQSEQDLEEFFMEVLEPIETYDRENNVNFLYILWQYFLNNRDKTLTAKNLFMHVNTLRYRLNKIEELLGVKLEDEETRFNIFAALKVAAILGKINSKSVQNL